MKGTRKPQLVRDIAERDGAAVVREAGAVDVAGHVELRPVELDLRAVGVLDRLRAELVAGQREGSEEKEEEAGEGRNAEMTLPLYEAAYSAMP
jgi:hypothetical protein